MLAGGGAMIFQQLFDKNSSTYTYILIQENTGEAIIIDPVFENIDIYTSLFTRLGVRLIKAIDTHTHADHISGLGELRDITRCSTVMGEQSKAQSVAIRLKDGDKINWNNINIKALYTPGHTDDSYCLLMDNYLFTGDTLLIGGSGRTDFQNGDPYAAYDSIFNKLLTLPEHTLVFPAHDYRGNTVSTIGYEKAHNPRLQVHSAEEYAEIMNNLNLPNPKLMDIAVPSNIALGKDISKYVHAEEKLEAENFLKERKSRELISIDIRELFERERDGIIPGSIHVPYTQFDDALKPGGILRKYLDTTPDLSRLVIICAFGERSAMAIDAIRKSGYHGLRHLHGGFAAWIKAGGEITQITKR